MRSTVAVVGLCCSVLVMTPRESQAAAEPTVLKASVIVGNESGTGLSTACHGEAPEVLNEVEQSSPGSKPKQHHYLRDILIAFGIGAVIYLLAGLAVR